MKKNPHPPAWADRFLNWYCNPELLEEIQGDAHELYYERVEQRGKLFADFLYVWDIIRFCRLSNIERESEFNQSGFFGLLWNINLKLALRNARRNKLVFGVKLIALGICLAFSLLLTALVINDTTYDHHYPDYQSLYRVGCNVNFQGKESNYAVSPLPMGPVLAEEIAGIDGYTRFIIVSNTQLKVDEKRFYGITTYAADSNFLKLFPQRFIEGTRAAFGRPNSIVLTKSVAYNIFGSQSALGKTIDLGQADVEVAGVIDDLPLNTHFTFQALVSWNTFERDDTWTNINAYTYIRVMPNTIIAELDSTIALTVGDYLRPTSDSYKFDFHPILQRIDEIHLSGFMDEDFAIKRNRSYIFIIISVIGLFLLTGLFNYLNLALTQLTLQLKTISILKAFGGHQANCKKMAITDAILSLLIVAPMVVAVISLVISHPGLFPSVDSSSWTHLGFLALIVAIVIIVIVASALNGVVASGTTSMVNNAGLPGRNGLGLRRFLVASQLAFSMVMIGLIAVILQQFRFVNESDKGFESSNVVVIRRQGNAKQNESFENSIRTLPGVQLVSGSSFLPEGGVETKDIFEMETPVGRKSMLLNFIFGETEYPELLGMRLKSGKFFPQSDEPGYQRAFIINESAAKLFGWEDPIGKTIHFPANGDETGAEIIGIVKDFHFESMHSKIEPLIIVLTNGEWGINFIYVKTNPLASVSLLEAITREHKKLFPDAPIESDFLEGRYQNLYRNDFEIRDIFQNGLIISLVVSLLGIFSISALILSLRNKEMGIRKVIGASDFHLFSLHLKPFAIFFLIATGFGLPLVFFLSRQWLNNFAYHIALTPRYFILPAVSTIFIILLASGYHAFRCARVNPVDILKEE